ncbi:MAG TPA: DNA-3-methyladenine glycosylase [Candidatus Saccharimonadales bacterium]|nr:DNA-3-methyladenine glycosylase [Candidatus Saccharimonadales bacterium]
MTIEQKIAEAEAKLPELDAKLGQLIRLQKPIVHKPRANYFFSLCRSIVGQQVSVAAAATIFGRLEAATGIEPKKVTKLTEKQIKSIGLSRQKAGYIKDLAQHFVDNPEVYNHLGQLSDEEVIADLTAVKGIGVWTAQMFLMFTLVRLDVFAPDDIGLQRAMKQLYGWKSTPGKEKLEKTAAKWRPYRTVACWHLWQSLHNTP